MEVTRKNKKPKCFLYAPVFAIWICIFALLIPQNSSAALNQFGESGLIEQPMAATLDPGGGGVSLGMYYFDALGEGDLYLGPAGIAFGLNKNSEVGFSTAAYPDYDVYSGGSSNSLRLSLKYRFLSDTDGIPAFAAYVWGDNLLTIPGAGVRVIAQKQTDHTQIVGSVGYLYRPGGSYAFAGAGFDKEFNEYISVLLDLTYAYPLDPDMDARARGWPAVRYNFNPKLAVTGAVGPGMDGDEFVLEGLVTVSLLSDASLKEKRAWAGKPEEVPPEEIPPPEEEEPYTTPKPEFKLKIPISDME